MLYQSFVFRFPIAMFLFHYYASWRQPMSFFNVILVCAFFPFCLYSSFRFHILCILTDQHHFLVVDVIHE